MQSNLNNWDVVNTQIEISTKKRSDNLYKNVFGCSLTKKITELHGVGLTNKEIIQKLNDELVIAGIIDTKIFNNVRIGVCSRLAEQNTYDKRK